MAFKFTTGQKYILPNGESYGKGIWFDDVDGNGKYDGKDRLIRPGNRIRNKNGDYVQLNSDGTMSGVYRAKTGTVEEWAKSKVTNNDIGAMQRRLVARKNADGTHKWDLDKEGREKKQNEKFGEVQVNKNNNGFIDSSGKVMVFDNDGNPIDINSEDQMNELRSILGLSTPKPEASTQSNPQAQSQNPNTPKTTDEAPDELKEKKKNIEAEIIAKMQEAAGLNVDIDGSVEKEMAEMNPYNEKNYNGLLDWYDNSEALNAAIAKRGDVPVTYHEFTDRNGKTKYVSERYLRNNNLRISKPIVGDRNNMRAVEFNSFYRPVEDVEQTSLLNFSVPGLLWGRNDHTIDGNTYQIIGGKVYKIV